MLLSLLTSIYGAYLRITTPSDYEILREELEYTIDQHAKYEIDDDFWRKESRFWGAMDELYVNVTGKPFRNTVVPQNVRKLILRVSYWYGGRKYKLISKNMDFKWPPRAPSMTFTMPLASAYLCDADDKVQRDVTEKIRRYSGPNGDFHGERVPIRDMLYYDDDTLRELYPYITIKNLIGQTKTVSTRDGFTTELGF
jgi:hypothetical protein